jgi:hypothetical protein
MQVFQSRAVQGRAENGKCGNESPRFTAFTIGGQGAKTKSATPWNCGFWNAYMGMNAPEPKDGLRVAPDGRPGLPSDAAAGAKGKIDD